MSEAFEEKHIASSIKKEEEGSAHITFGNQNPSINIEDQDYNEKVILVSPVSKVLKGNSITDYYLEIEFEITSMKNIKDFCLSILPGESAQG